MKLHREPSPLLIPLTLLVTVWHPGTWHVSYTPQLSNSALEGKLTQSTFALEQPLGQFDKLNISDSDPIWLVVANSNAIRKFVAPKKVEDMPAPDSLAQRGYYFTLRANRAHYQGDQTGRQLRVLRVGNDTACPPESQNCNTPLPSSGPYRVKFLVMNSKGPVAETEWSKDIDLLQAQEFQHAPGYQSAGTVVIIAFQSIMLAILLAVFVVLVISPCFRNVPISSPSEQVHMRQYSTHHMDSPPGLESS
uniref:Uroplakin-3b-like protein n=1 Tax=Jaculus jaculus TaxID=51337 RepID=A0A8C5KVV4_JACJA